MFTEVDLRLSQHRFNKAQTRVGLLSRWGYACPIHVAIYLLDNGLEESVEVQILLYVS